MGFEVSYREHKFYAGLNPDFTFSKPDGTTIRTTTSNPSLGRGYFFFVVDRAWLHNKYIRWRWQGGYSYTFATAAAIWDGEFVRSSMVDFPNGAPPITKGNGVLQTLDLNSGAFAMETKDIQANTAGGSETKCTIIFYTHDSWNGQSGWFQMDWIEVNENAGGAGNINTEHFTDAIIPEVAGTFNDYGYIGYGQADPITLDLFATFSIRHLQDASTELSGKFIVRHSDSEELPAEFESGQGSENLLGEFIPRRSASVELLGEFIARHAGSENLPGEFIARHAGSENLPGEFIVRRSSSEALAADLIIRHAATRDLAAGFWVRYYSEDLYAKVYIRPESSRATDFEVKDNTRGLTVHDPDREMTVTSRRKMRVK